MSDQDYETRRSRIVELLEDDTLSGYDIDTKIVEEFGCTRDAARKARKRILGTGARKQKVDKAEDHGDVGTINWQSKQYDFDFSMGRAHRDIVTGVWKPKRDFFDIPFLEMQDYCWEYADKGGRKTRAEVCRLAWLKYNRELTTDYWRRICACLDFTKKSVPMAPHKYQENTQEEIVNQWRERDEAGVEARYQSDEIRHLKGLLARKTKELNHTRDYIVECIEDIEFTPLPEMKPLTAPALIRGADSVGDLLLSDWHYGLSLNEDYNVFNREVAENRIEEYLDKLNEFHQRNGSRFVKFNVPILGDMIDGVHGDMHPDQHLEQDVRGVRQAVGASDLLTVCLRGIYKIVGTKLKTIKTVPGNHGRDSMGRSGDPQRIPETLMYHMTMAKAQLPSSVGWDIAEDGPHLEWVEYNMRFVAGHGDKTPKDARKTAWPRLRRGQHVVLYAGHKHEVQVNGIYDANYTFVQNGCVCGSTPYSVEQLGYHTLPAQVISEVTPEGIIVHPQFLLAHGVEQRW